MASVDDPALVSYVADHSSAVALAVYDASDPAAARTALQSAAEEISRIPHPDEPDWSLPNWCAVLDEDGVSVLRIDMKDEIRYSALIVRIVQDHLARAGVDGRLEPRRRPAEPFENDPNAQLFVGTEPLIELDHRGLPPGFPDGFPVPPDATLVRAERTPGGDAEHATWRRSEPFTGYLAQLRAYGCTFGEVPRLATVNSGPGEIARYTLWRDGAGGRVRLYHSGLQAWYVSVVWQPEARPPTTPVEPDETPDRRPVPSGREAARELAEFLVPEPLVPGYEAVIALATAAHTLSGLLHAGPGRRGARGDLTTLADRFAPVLGRLTPEQLTLLRHVCLTMISNLLASGRRGRPSGLTLVPDDDGYLYAADVREHAENTIDAALLLCFETGLVVVRGAPMVAEAVSGIRDAPVPPPVEQYAWLFDGLDAPQLTAARDACWDLFE
ncbi:hypothetical protein [Cryptosporangium aurantiacum]|uniref:Uncharacterized protein n=1 Tax=Cryptosporangium aurantiacum TaxID=134849 RepID=A0A1M7RKT5_9ACTN|nr:hypothetical protein [Cryptosporangium aurantiacum]SHN46955.1 hypothetical protein SAMN05443668_11951 [Cryptosporangium aurantiacum]